VVEAATALVNLECVDGALSLRRCCSAQRCC
jgi:hypothetical protein